MGFETDLFDAREIDLKARAEAESAIDPDVAAALLDDSVDGGEAEASSLSDFLGGEEWLEDVRESLLGHAGAGVGHRKHDVATGLRARMFAAVVLVELAIRSFDLELAAVRASRRAR